MQEPIKTSTGMDQNVAGLLCYAVGWISGLVFFLLEKENRFVRFHAMQSMITFGAVAALFIVLPWVPFIGWALMPVVWIVGVILWVLLMVKAWQGERYKLPFVGDIAEKNI